MRATGTLADRLSNAVAVGDELQGRCLEPLREALAQPLGAAVARCECALTIGSIFGCELPHSIESSGTTERERVGSAVLERRIKHLSRRLHEHDLLLDTERIALSALVIPARPGARGRGTNAWAE